MSRGLCLLAFLFASAAPAAAAPFKPTRFSVSVTGSGPDVILIPGLASSPGIWRGTVAGVRGYRYHLVHVSGFAGAPAAGNRQGAVAAPLAQEIAAYIRANRLSRPAIVGHSLGGSVAMMLAARHPGAVGRVMVVDMLPTTAGAFGVPAAAAKPLARLIGGEWEGVDHLRRDLKTLVGRFGSADWLESRSDASVVGRSIEELIATDLTAELPRIRAPLTVLYACPAALKFACGPIDRTYSLAYSKRPGARLVRIDRSGHSIMLDQPATFQARLRDFLR